jgi:ATP-dependent Clp protease adapter protein ClpS
MNTETIDLSKKRYIVSVYEIQQEIVDWEEFSGHYARTITLSDGTTRTLELTPVMHEGRAAFELNDTGRRTYMGSIRVRTGGHTNGTVMVQIIDRDDLDAARADWRRDRVLTSPVLPAGTSLICMPDFIPAGFSQGIEILNDNTTQMNFVVAVLSTHLGLSPEDSNRTMLAIHTRGGALIPTASLAEAQRICAQITAEAAQHSYPLVCRPVSIVQSPPKA